MKPISSIFVMLAVALLVLPSQVNADEKPENDIEKLKANYEKRISELENQLRTVTKQLEEYKSSLQEIAKISGGKAIDSKTGGRIVWVDQSKQAVWINLGMADGVKPKSRFNVFPSDSKQRDRPVQKGQIEVTRILDKHLSEARILSATNENPILPSDLIQKLDGIDAEEFEKPTPQVNGQVLNVARNRYVEISVGSDDGIAKGMELDIVRGKKYVGRIRIRDTQPDRSVGERLLRPSDLIKVGDRVTTRAISN